MWSRNSKKKQDKKRIFLDGCFEKLLLISEALKRKLTRARAPTACTKWKYVETVKYPLRMDPYKIIAREKKRQRGWDGTRKTKAYWHSFSSALLNIHESEIRFGCAKCNHYFYFAAFFLSIFFSPASVGKISIVGKVSHGISIIHGFHHSSALFALLSFIRTLYVLQKWECELLLIKSIANGQDAKQSI